MRWLRPCYRKDLVHVLIVYLFIRFVSYTFFFFYGLRNNVQYHFICLHDDYFDILLKIPVFMYLPVQILKIIVGVSVGVSVCVFVF